VQVHSQLQGPLQRAILHANIPQQLSLDLEQTMTTTTDKKPAREYTTFNLVDSARLTMLVQDEYTASDKSDDAFAQYASQKLGRRVTESNVFNRRRQLGIQSKKDRDTEAHRAAEAARKAAAEEKKAKRKAEVVAGTPAADLETLIKNLQARVECVERYLGIEI
jgi:hypothetical protein